MRVINELTQAGIKVHLEPDPCYMLEDSECIMTARPIGIEYCSSCPMSNYHHHKATAELPN